METIKSDEFSKRYYPKSEEEAVGLQRTCNTDHPIRCADGRSQADNLSNEELLETDGPHIIGGTSFPYYVTARIATELGIDLDQETLWRYSMQAVENAGFKNGVHVDNHHHDENGGYSTGCGWEAHLGNDPEYFGVGKYGMPIQKITELARSAGVPVMVLGGDHKEGYAIVNHKAGTTLNTEKANNEDKQGFCQDIWAARIVLAKMAEILSKSGQNALADRMMAQSTTSENMNYADEVGSILLGQVLEKLSPEITKDHENRIIHVH